MFTGIIEEIGKIKKIENNEDGFKVKIVANNIFQDLKINDSVACSGICLTVTNIEGNTFTVQLVNETINRTTAKFWEENTTINLERALLPTTRISGHFVQGHVDATSKIINIKKREDSAEFVFLKDPSFKNYIIEKGSVCLDGISLTIAENKKNSFKVALIPHTLKITNWGRISIGDNVNVEVDMMAKYIENIMSKNK